MKVDRIFSVKYEYYVILGILLGVPLYFDLRLFDAFILPKRTIFDSLFLIFFFLRAGRAFIEQKIDWPVGRPFNLSVALFVAAEIVSLIFAADTGLAWFGSPLRLFGSLLSLQLFVVFLWLVENYDFVKKRIGWLINTVVFSGLIVSGYSLVQAFGFDQLKWQVYEGILIRTSSTLGQPNFLASFLLGSLAMTGLGLYETRKTAFRVFYALSLGAELSALVYTLSRGAWLGLLAALTALSLVFAYKKKRKLFWLASSALAILFAAWLVIGLGGFVDSRAYAGQGELEKRIVSVLDFREASIRKYYYQAAIDLIAKQPFSGYGRDSLAARFAPYYAPGWSVYEVINQSTDRAHNFWLDLWLQVGLVGVLFWLHFLFLLFKAVSARFWFAPVAVFASAALISLLVSWQVSFVTLEPALLFWLWAGLAVGESGPEKKELRFNFIHFVVLGSVFFFFCLSGLLSDTNRVAVSRAYQQLLKVNDVTRNIDDVKAVLGLATVSDLRNFYGPRLYGLIDDKIKLQRIDSSDLDSIVRQLEDLGSGKANFDYQFNRLIFLTNMSKELFWRGSGKNLALSLEQDYAGLKENARGYAVLELGWGNLLFYQRKFSEALAHYREALALYPDLSNPQINAEHKGYIEFERNQVLARISTCEQELKNEIIIRGKDKNKK
jgi:putative inorganic carbon (HCO3(-)) transporter